MPNPDILDQYSSQLVGLLAGRGAPPNPCPIETTPWIAMSLMQKAVRRGNSSTALMAAATLLRDAPERLWRRIGCIAYEDIGVADIKCLGLVTASLTGKVLRNQLGGEWAVASLIVQIMAEATKNRSADDLLMTIAALPSLQKDRQQFTQHSDERLQQIVLGCSDIHRRGLALWYLIGTKRCPSPNLIPRQGNLEMAFEVLAEHGVSPSMVQITRQGFIKTREVLAPFVGLLAFVNKIRGIAPTNDVVPSVRLAGGVPSYALDTYTREGKRAFAQFLQSNVGTANWIRANLPNKGRSAFLGELVFRVEGGCLVNRSAGLAADGLRQQYELECLGVGAEKATDVLSLMQSDIPLLNKIRANVMGGGK